MLKDISNGFKLFSLKYLNLVEIESKRGFTFSIELLVKLTDWLQIAEIPSIWKQKNMVK